MKKLSRRGFTLVELLVVLVILTVIMAIAIPSVTSSIERSKEKQKASKIELILASAELYVDKHKNSYHGEIIEVKTLICDKLLTKEEAKDPFNEKYTMGGYVTYNNGDYTWVANNTDAHRVLIEENLSC